MIAFPEAVADTAHLDPASIADNLRLDGPIATAMAQYEDRPTQRQMAMAIAELYNDGGVGLIEAGTGVGKSLGYLLPALRWANLTGERTVVSTNTINLQEQLVRKDLPFLQKALAAEQPADCPVAARLCGGVLSLPLHPALRDDEVDEVAAAVHAFQPRTVDS